MNEQICKTCGKTMTRQTTLEEWGFEFLHEGQTRLF